MSSTYQLNVLPERKKTCPGVLTPSSLIGQVPPSSVAHLECLETDPSHQNALRRAILRHSHTYRFYILFSTNWLPQVDTVFATSPTILQQHARSFQLNTGVSRIATFQHALVPPPPAHAIPTSTPRLLPRKLQCISLCSPPSSP